MKGMLDMELDEINDKTVEGLKKVSRAEVGISIKKRVTDTRVHTDVKEVVTSLTLAASWRIWQPNENPKKRLLN